MNAGAMSAEERRQPRARFTRALRRICERLDAQNTHEVTWTERIFPGEILRGVMRAESLWVVGSYARGAPLCGDLDLVLKLVCVEGERAPLKKFVSKAVSRLPGVRWYSGDPEENSSGVSFPEAVHIWSKGKSWQAAFAGIREETSAGRFARSTDDIPLRGEQLHADVGDLEEVLQRRSAGEIQWRFLPVDTSLDPLPHPTDVETEILARLRYGKRTRQLLPYLLRYFRDHALPLCSRYSRPSGSAELELEGVYIAMGRPRIAHDQLDTLQFSRAVLMPHLSRRGPNGIWELQRGANHPFEKRLRDIGVYIVKTGSGAPDRVQCVNRWSEGELLELFATEELARKHALEQQRERGCSGLQPAYIHGTELLEILSYADAFELHTKDGACTLHCLTHMGRVVFGEEGVSAQPEPPDCAFDAIV